MTFPACSDGPSAEPLPRYARTFPRAAAPPIAAIARSRRCCALAVGTPAWAFDPFTVRDIRVEGVQRTEAGTIFSYLPIKVGERVDDEKVAQAVKALYATGFFRDVRIEAQGDILVVTVAGAADDQLAHVRRQQGIRHRHGQEGAEGDRHRRRRASSTARRSTARSRS